MNVEIVRAYFEAFDSGELDRAAEYLDPDVRWTNSTLIDDRTVTGRAAVRTYWDRILSTFPFVHDHPTFSAAGDRVCVIAHVRAKGAASGIELAAPCGYALYAARRPHHRVAVLRRSRRGTAGGRGGRVAGGLPPYSTTTRTVRSSRSLAPRTLPPSSSVPRM